MCQVLVGKRRSPAGLLGEVGLEPYFMYRYPREMSGGQRQRIVIALLLISHDLAVVVTSAPGRCKPVLI